MDTLHSMRIFKHVVEYAGFTTAAKHLDMDAAQVSRAVAELEAKLRTRLLHRTTRRVSLTEAGEKYLARCNQILMYVDEAEAEASGAHTNPSGTLKVQSLTGFGVRYLMPLISSYRTTFPEVDLDLTFSQRLPRLVEEGYDVTITLSAELPDSNLVCQNLGSIHSVLCASPKYIHANGAPRSLRELTEHTCLQLCLPTGPSDRWVFDGPNGTEAIEIGAAPMRVNVPEALAVAVESSIGIGVIPVLTALPLLQAGSLVRILPKYSAQQMNIYALYPSREYLDAKVRTFIAYLREHLASRIETDLESLQQLAAHLSP